MPSTRRDAWSVGLFLSLAFFVLGPGRVYSPDGVMMARVTESLVERGAFDIDVSAYPTGFVHEGAEGKAYPKYGLGFSVAAVPGYVVGRLLERLDSGDGAAAFAGPRFLWYDPESSGWGFFGISTTNGLVVAACCGLVVVVGLRLGWERRTALATALLAGLGSPLFVYAKSSFSEPLAALGLVLFAACLVGPELGSPRRDVVGGVGLGLVVAAKVAHLVLLPIAVLAWATAARRHGREWRDVGRSLGRLSVAPAITLVGLGLANTVRFGRPWETGYGDEVGRFTASWVEGLVGLLLSPGRGLLVYLPIVVFGVIGIRRLWSRRPELVIVTWGGLGALLGLYATWHGWDGGWCYGPRFLVPLFPLLVVASIDGWIGLRSSRFVKFAGGCLLAWMVIVAWVGVVVPSTEYHALLREVFGPSYLWVARWSVAAFPVWGYWRLPWSYFFVWDVVRTPSLWWLASVYGAAAGALVPLALRLRSAGADARGRSGGRSWWLAVPTGAAILGCGAWFLG